MKPLFFGGKLDVAWKTRRKANGLFFFSIEAMKRNSILVLPSKQRVPQNTALQLYSSTALAVVINISSPPPKVVGKSSDCQTFQQFQGGGGRGGSPLLRQSPFFEGKKEREKKYFFIEGESYIVLFHIGQFDCFLFVRDIRNLSMTPEACQAYHTVVWDVSAMYTVCEL